MSTSPHIANPKAASQYLGFFCSKLQFSECVLTFSTDIELRNDRIPRNPFDRQFRYEKWVRNNSNRVRYTSRLGP